ncbi:PAS domain S-box protein [Actinoplanes sp. NPDC051851]|uniref:PAS domain S-box protein n=1 Tax=Actinoplanes sp. NPDC051851 TaxID=3154753 RepID=UPI003440BB1B
MDTASRSGYAVLDPARLAAVAATGLTEIPDSPVLDRITALAARLVGGPLTLVTLVEADEQCFVSHAGPGSAGISRRTPMSHSYCRYVVEGGESLVVADAREHPLLRDNPAIVDYRAIAYLGVPVRSPDGMILGTLCAADTEPRAWSENDVALMEDLAAAATAEISARITAHEAARAATRLKQILETTLDAFVATDAEGRITGWNAAAEQLFGWGELEVLGLSFAELVVAPRHREAYATKSADGGRVETQAVHRGGRQFPIELAMTELKQADGLTRHAFIRDMTVTRRTEKLRRLEYSVAGTLAAAQSTAQAVEEIAARVGEGLTWPYVEYWHLNPENTQLIRLATWSRDDQLTAPMREMAGFPRGGSLVGQVWETGKARWIRDLPESGTPRAAAAAAVGLRTAVAVPVRNGTDVVGVLAAFDRRRSEYDPELLAALDTVAAHIGGYVHRRRAEELDLELSRARQELDRLVSNLSDHLWTIRVTDGRPRVIYSSPNIAAIYGGVGPDDENLATNMAEIVHPDDHAAFDDFSAVLSAGQPAQVTCRLVGRDHVTRWVWIRAVPRVEGNDMVIDGVCSDITERQADNARLRQQAELLDITPAAVIVRDLDSRITYWNKGAQATYGWTTDAVLGCVSHRLLDTRFPVLHPLVEAALAEDGRWEGELDHLRSDGTRITVLSRQVMQYDEDAQPTAILEVNVDMTARKNAERRLADSEQQLRTQFSLATVGQATLSLDGTFLQVNLALAEMLGRPVEELEGAFLDDVTHPDERPENHRTAARLFTNDTPADRQLRLMHADGRTVDAALGMCLVRDSDGQPISFIAVVQDITARLAAERERDAAAGLLADRNAELQDTNAALAAANALKQDLMGMLSHEIGTPLTTISGYAEALLARPATLDPSQARAADAIARSARRLELLRGEVLTMVTLDAGEIQATPEPVDMATAIAEAMATLDLSVPVGCPPGITVLVQPGHLQQIIINFCTNAAKYAGGITAISVTESPPLPGTASPAGPSSGAVSPAGHSSGTATISVYDEGPGIPEHLRPQLFDRYTRAADTATTVIGHGLGLHIVKGLAEANHGTVGCHPNTPTGSVFTLTLPTA